MCTIYYMNICGSNELQGIPEPNQGPCGCLPDVPDCHEGEAEEKTEGASKLCHQGGPGVVGNLSVGVGDKVGAGAVKAAIF